MNYQGHIDALSSFLTPYKAGKLQDLRSALSSRAQTVQLLDASSLKIARRSTDSLEDAATTGTLYFDFAIGDSTLDPLVYQQMYPATHTCFLESLSFEELEIIWRELTGANTSGTSAPWQVLMFDDELLAKASEEIKRGEFSEASSFGTAPPTANERVFAVKGQGKKSIGPDFQQVLAVSLRAVFETTNEHVRRVPSEDESQRTRLLEVRSGSGAYGTNPTSYDWGVNPDY